MSDQGRKVLLIASVPLALLILLFAAWGVSALVAGDQVARNVYVDDTDLSGLDPADVEAVASDMNDALAAQPASLQVGDQLLDTNMFEMGVRVDSEQLVTDAMAAREGGFILFRPFTWLASFFNEVQIEADYYVDHEASSQAAKAIVDGQLTQPTDPYFETTDAGLVVVPGMDGTTIAFDRVGSSVESALAAGEPFVVEVEPLPLAPSLETATLQAVADEANTATAEPVEIMVLGQIAVVEPAQMRSWILLDVESDPPNWSFDNNSMIAELRPLFPELGGEDQLAHFTVVDGEPIIIPASESVVCCEDDSADRLKAALLAPAPEPEEPSEDDTDEDDADEEDAGPPLRRVELAPELTGGDAGAAELETLGIVEEVATFTTNHPCCQNRVKNIQRMAEIVQGYVIRPGEVFDLNEIVGKRTTEKGFLPAGAIAQGVLEDQVGGGVSQFTTTMFNAAFFAGMDFVEYQAHSIYFSRYPRGREATISWPKPDFIVRNNTEYGILVWPTWTDSSITVTLYSTKNIEVQDLGSTDTAQGACTRVTTTRERTYADGSVERDTVFAVYRPGEGLDCAGNPTKPTTTTTVDPNESTSTSEGGETTTTDGGGETTTTDGGGETTTTAPPETTTTTAPPDTTAPPSSDG